MLNLSDYNDKKVRVFLHDGSTFEGYSTHNSVEYSFSEFGVDSECLQICDYLIREEEIERIELIEALPSVRSTEEELGTDKVEAERRRNRGAQETDYHQGRKADSGSDVLVPDEAVCQFLRQ